MKRTELLTILKDQICRADMDDCFEKTHLLFSLNSNDGVESFDQEPIDLLTDYVRKKFDLAQMNLDTLGIKDEDDIPIEFGIDPDHFEKVTVVAESLRKTIEKEFGMNYRWNCVNGQHYESGCGEYSGGSTASATISYCCAYCSGESSKDFNCDYKIGVEKWLKVFSIDENSNGNYLRANFIDNPDCPSEDEFEWEISAINESIHSEIFTGAIEDDVIEDSKNIKFTFDEENHVLHVFGSFSTRINEWDLPETYESLDRSFNPWPAKDRK